MGERAARVLGSVRLRLTAVATLATAAALVLGSFALVWRVRTSLEDEARAAGARVLGEAVARAQTGTLSGAGAGLGPGVRGVSGWSAGPDGTLIFATNNGVAGAASSLPGLPPTGGDVIVFTQRVSGPGGPFTVAVASPLDGVRRSVDALARVLWLAVPAMIALVGAVAWFLTGRALRPVEGIRAEVDEISHTTMHRRVPVPRARDEVRALALTMNEMLDRLERAAARQREFVSDASHELRSPVAAIRTELEVAVRDPERADWERVAHDVLAEDERLGVLVDDLLELARLEEGVPLHLVEVDLDDVVLADCARRNGAIAIDTAGVSGGAVRGDARRLAQVVQNLVDNAVRHSRAGVAVSLGTEAGHVVLHVDDDGPGVAVEDRTRVFDRFTRLDEGRTRDRGGTGLGLAVAARIVAAHDGSIACGDAPALAGARFTVSLPALTERSGR